MSPREVSGTVEVLEGLVVVDFGAVFKVGVILGVSQQGRVEVFADLVVKLGLGVDGFLEFLQVISPYSSWMPLMSSP